MRNTTSKTVDDVFAASWLHGVPAEIVEQLRQISDTKSYKDGQVVYASGSPQEYLWGVKTGQLRMAVAMNELQPVLGHIHHAGAWLGETAVILGSPAFVEMRATDSVTMTRLKYSQFKALADKHPTLWAGLAKLTAYNQLLAMSAAKDLVLRTSRERIAATLLRLAGHRGVVQASAKTNAVLATQKELADLANLALSKTSEHLRDMSKDGLIGLEYKRIVLKDLDGLKNMVLVNGN